MPTIWLLQQTTTSSSTTPVVWIDTAGTATTSSTPIWTTAVGTATTSSTPIWTTIMAHTAFDTSDRYYYDQLALQRRLLDTRPGSIVQLNNDYRQLVNDAQQLGDSQIARQMVEAQMQRQEVELRYMREMQEREQQHARNREAARNRARDLLMDHLTEAQRETVRTHGWFVVEGGVSKRSYRIHTNRGPAGNIEELGSRMLMGDRPVARLCAHVRHVALPDYDEFLAQMIMLQADEEAFLGIANRSVMR